MRRLLATVVLCGVAASASAQSVPDSPAAVEAALARVAPSLVRVHVVSIEYQSTAAN